MTLQTTVHYIGGGPKDGDSDSFKIQPTELPITTTFGGRYGKNTFVHKYHKIMWFADEKDEMQCIYDYIGTFDI